MNEATKNEILSRVNQLLEMKAAETSARCDYNATGSRMDGARHEKLYDLFGELWQQFETFLNVEQEKSEAPSIDLPEDASDWELYTTKPGADHAAQRLNLAILTALREPNYTRATEIVDRALEEESEFGATDTEPRGVAYDLLRDNHPARKNAKR